MVKTKIICTVGPTSSNSSVLYKMMQAGMDVVRFNFSHLSQKDASTLIETVRRLNRKYRRAVRILGDLQGHRIRIGRFAKPIFLPSIKIFYLTNDAAKISLPRFIYFDYPESLQRLKKGMRIFVDDGNVVFEILSVHRDFVKVKRVRGEWLYPSKGVNIPDVEIDFGPLTQKDRSDILFCLQHKFDYIAQSFVRNDEDVCQVKKMLADAPIKVVAKIENREGLKNILKIMEAADAIMIARGDLGVCLDIAKVPILQKEIIKLCRHYKKPVITATQMLESMTHNFIPTRAEVSDVANAIIDGTDFVMLSAETAVGKFPVQTVRMMNEIIKVTEGYLRIKERKRSILNYV